ncbi:alpha/beta fold hydrolase [Propionivibrio sp.]|uniref:alpha/beta fold hydrolase n=1 Tax=Propionivibrio sp. TaxID=2212460 RepID=UPI003BEFB096
MQHETISADDGEQLHIRASGNGVPILLLHGWTSSHAAWAPLLKPLGAQHRLLRPDARGHGGHPLTVNHAPDVKRLARDIINLLDHYQIERVAAVGHSMGALTLWQCIRDFGTERFSHIAFIDQSPKLLTDETWSCGIYGDFDSARAQRLLDDLGGDFIEAVLRLIAFGLNDKARETYLRNTSGWRAVRDSLRNIDPPPAIAIWNTLVAADYRDVLPAIDVPTLLAYGTCSNFYTEATARYVAAHIPRARLSLYEGADHCPHLFQPERFAAELSQLLNTVKVAPATLVSPLAIRERGRG